MTKLLRILPILVLAIIIPSFVEVDITLPGFPQMSKYFNSSVEDIQWTLVINFIGLCIFTLLYGPISDALGRKKVLTWGCALFFIASIGCLLVNNIHLLYICRFLQGLGCSAIWVVGFVVVSDVYNANESIRVFGLLNAAISASLTIAPMVGSFIVANYNWRATYFFIAILSFISLFTAVILLPETNLSKKPLKIKESISQYTKLLACPRYLAYALTPSILLSGLIAYVSAIPFLYLEQLHVSFHLFALYQAMVGGCLAIFGALSGKIYEKMGADRSILLSVIICLLGSILLIISSKVFPLSALYFTLSMCVICIGSSIQFSMVFAKSLDLFPELRGASSSLITFARLILFSVSVIFVGKCYSGQLCDIAYVISAIITTGLALSLYLRCDLKSQIASSQTANCAYIQ